MLSSSSPRVSTTMPEAVPLPPAGRGSNLGIEWDAENRLVAVKQDANTVASYTYRYDGLRTSKAVAGTTTTFVLDDKNVVEERASGGAAVKHFHAATVDTVLGTMDAAGEIQYLTWDHLGSVREAVSPVGVVRTRRDYDPWGRILLSSATGGWAYTGRESDAETGLQYYRTRYFEPPLGRFLSEDVAGLQDGPNLYRYVRNMPIVRRDPDGRRATLYCEVVQQAPHSGPVGGTHCYLDVTCPGRYRKVLEMWGPTAEEPTKGRPMSPPPNDQRNQKAVFYTTICGGGGSSCNSDCKLEDRLVECFEKVSKYVPPYNPFGPNSNTFANRVMRCAGAGAMFPITAAGASWCPKDCGTCNGR